MAPGLETLRSGLEFVAERQFIVGRLVSVAIVQTPRDGREPASSKIDASVFRPCLPALRPAYASSHGGLHPFRGAYRRYGGMSALYRTGRTRVRARLTA